MGLALEKSGTVYGLMPRLRLRAPLLAILVVLLANTTSARDAAAPLPDVVPRKDSLPHAHSPTLQTPVTKIRRAEIGTKDAPVDGLDGKPHAGPFVDSTGASRSTEERKSSSLRDTQTAKDGVMNDQNRHEPKKGTIGTEGGVSEKDRDRKIHESSTGQRMAKVPSPPKASPTLADRDVAAEAEPAAVKKVSDASSDRSSPAKEEAVSHEVFEYQAFFHHS